MDYITKHDRSGLVREIKSEQDISYGNEKIDKPVYAKFKFDDSGNLISEDYSKLESVLDNFIEKYKRVQTKDHIVYVRLNDLTRLKLCLLEEYYAFEYLKSKDIMVRGISEDISYENYQSITTHKYEGKSKKEDIADWSTQKVWFEKYHEAIDRDDKKESEKYINLIYKNNTRLIEYFTNNIMLKYNLPDQDKDDCLSYANIAFLRSLSCFDASKGCRFSTYLYIAIKNTILREWLREKGLGTNWEEYFKYKRGVDAAGEVLYDMGIDRKPTYDELEDLFTYTDTLSRSAISRLYERTGLVDADSIDDESKYSTYTDDKDKLVLSDTLSDEELSAPETEELILDFDLEKETDIELLRIDLINAIDSLSDQEKNVLIKRFGLGGDKPMTLEEVAKTLNVTRERVRQIEAKALRRLRHPKFIKKFKDYYKYINSDVIVGHRKI